MGDRFLENILVKYKYWQMRCARKGGNFIQKKNLCPEKGGGMDLCC